MKTTIDIGNFAIVRSPLLPLSIFQAWRASDNSDEFILSLFDQPLVDEALYLSSMSLHARLQEFRNGEGEAAQHPSERKKLVGSLAKYISRAAYRCTPFGLFAQVQLARFVEGKGANDEPPSRNLRRGIHLDGAVEARLIEKALTDQSYREQLKWQISSTAFVYGAHLSYVDWVYQTNWQRTYRAVELRLNDALLVLKNHCQEPLAFQEVCNLLTSDPDISEEEAREFIHELITRRLLLPDLAPSCGNTCSFDESLAKSPEHPALVPLRHIQQQLHQMREKEGSAESLVSQYQAIYRNIEEQIGDKNLNQGAVQIDSVLPGTVDINNEHAKGLAKTVQLIATHCMKTTVAMQDYKALFRERFEDREVNLAYALHSELGVPYPNRGQLDSPLINGLGQAFAFGGRGGGAGGGGSPLSKLDLFLIKSLFESASKSNEVIKVSIEDLEKMEPATLNRSHFAEGLYTQVSVHPTHSQQAPVIELRHIGGRSGLELVARFAHLSPEITTAAQDYYRDFSRHKENCIYAEIIHHPQDRLLNITRKPRLSEYDLVFAGASELPRTQQLWLEDLTIQLSGDRFILRDKKTGKQVIPRLTSAHNYSMKQLGIYQFLASLQDDDAGWSGFNWPAAVADFDYLPRVEIAGLIVARAQWLLKKEDITALNQALVEGTLAAWCADRKLPRFISYDAGDNQLPVDLENVASVHALLDEIIKAHSVQVYENLSLNLAQQNHLWGQHAQEWIVPLQLQIEESDNDRNKSQSLALTPRPIAAEGAICPNLDEWVYLRIYTGSGYADRVLRECVGTVLREAQESGLIDRWFFIRYMDRFEHLRVRFHSTHAADLLATMDKLHTQIKLARQDGLLWRVQTDDYILEDERYGGRAALVLCEQLFTLDSEDFMVLLDIEAQFAGEHDRWLYAMASIDHYAQRLCPDAAEREKFLETMAENFLNEQSTATTRSGNIVALGARFRDMRKPFDALRTGTPALNAWNARLQKQMQSRNDVIEQLMVLLRETSKEKQLGVLQSLMHMHCNRFAPSEPRLHETVFYDFAKRLERARQAKQRGTKQVQV